MIIQYYLDGMWRTSLPLKDFRLVTPAFLKEVVSRIVR